MKILSISQQEMPGGAETTAYNLFKAYRTKGHQSWMAVKKKVTDDPDIYEIPYPQRLFSNLWKRNGLRLQKQLPESCKSIRRLLGRLSILPQLKQYLAAQAALQDFGFRGARRLLSGCPSVPDVIHCHNLHVNYFDLSVLPELSGKMAVVLNLRDSWLLTGHCAYPGNCERWKTGCGHCPDLQRYPGLDIDCTARNWETKAKAFKRGRFFVTAPSKWQLDQVFDSMLAEWVVASRVIPNGIDALIFSPQEQKECRGLLGLPESARIVLMTAHHEYKDIETMRKAASIVAANWKDDKKLVFLCLGVDGATECLGNAELRYTGYIQKPKTLSRYYAASDIYIHAAEAEAFGKTITEAMSCGIPVVATAVGGIPEQVRDGVTGCLVPAKDAAAMAERIVMLLGNDEMRRQWGLAARQHVLERYTLDIQADAFLAWFEEITQVNRKAIQR